MYLIIYTRYYEGKEMNGTMKYYSRDGAKWRTPDQCDLCYGKNKTFGGQIMRFGRVV